MRAKLSVSLLQVVEGPKRGDSGEASSLGDFENSGAACSPEAGFQHSPPVSSPQLPSSELRLCPLLGLHFASMFNLLILPRIQPTADSMEEASAWALLREDPLDLANHASTLTPQTDLPFSLSLLGRA